MSTDKALHSLCLASWLRTLREEKGVGQAEVAEASGVSQPVLSRMETPGRRAVDVYTLGQVGKALGMELPALLAAAEECASLVLRAGHALVGSKAAPTAEYLRGRLGEQGLQYLACAAARTMLSSEKWAGR